MINSYLVQQIKGNFLYKPTLEQEKAVKFLADFLFSRQSDSVFLLKGYAGTGKTSLIGALVKTLDQLQQKCVLLAPTGRAAKVFSHYAQHPAYTIHKKIYRQRNFSNDLDNFSLDDNLHQHTLFIVDEASMIANDGLAGAVFGTGRLLDDLIQYVYAGTGCRLMLVGDTAQLPPVGEEESPSLSADKLRGYGMEVYEVQLTEVVRQMHDSGILWNATELRRYISAEDFLTLPSVRVEGFPDIRMVSGSELIDTWLFHLASTSLLFKNKQLIHIPNLCDINIFKPMGKGWAKRLFNLSESKKLILFGAATGGMGNIYKGWEYLQKAILHLSTSSYEAVIFGEYNKTVEKQLPIKCNFIGKLYDEYSLSVLYNAADVFVTPSLADNFPNTILESLSCGTPVVAFNVGGIPDLIMHKSNGYLAHYKDCEDLKKGIEWCVSQYSIQEVCRSSIIKKYSPSLIIEKHKKLMYGKI